MVIATKGMPDYPESHDEKPRKAVAFRKEFRHYWTEVVILDGAQQVNANGVPEARLCFPTI